MTVLIFFDGDQVTVQNRHMMDITCTFDLYYIQYRLEIQVTLATKIQDTSS